MIALLGLLGGPFSRIELYGVGLAALIAGGWFVVHEHDARLLAQQAARAQAVVAAQELADAKAATAQVQAVADETTKRLGALATARTEISHATAPAASCGAPAAVLRAVDALRTGP